jgi:hypothetical protein
MASEEQRLRAQIVELDRMAEQIEQMMVALRAIRIACSRGSYQERLEALHAAQRVLCRPDTNMH